MINDGYVTIILRHFYSIKISTLMIQMQRPLSTLAMVWTVGAPFLAQGFFSNTCRQFNWAGIPLNQNLGEGGGVSKRWMQLSNAQYAVYWLRAEAGASTKSKWISWQYLSTECAYVSNGLYIWDPTFQLVKECEPQMANWHFLYIVGTSGGPKADSRSNVQRYTCSGG